MPINRRQFSLGLMSLAATPALSRLSFGASPDRPLLPIPSLIDAAQGRIPLRMQQGQWAFDGQNAIATWGFSQPYLGPVLRTRRGAELALHYENQLAEGVAVHGHGLHVSGELDGGPHRLILPGESWRPDIPIAQQAATLWYHAHTHGKTGPQVYKGLAGLLIIDDDNSDKLPLPRRYGIDDIPFIVQDKDFKADGELDYNRGGMGRFYAGTMMVNGRIEPKLKVPKGLVRLRILNGSNGRFFFFAFADNRSFIHIASDGGLLQAPVETDRLYMGPGDRNEILVDFSDGRPALLRSVPKPAEAGEFNFSAVQGEQDICHFEPDPKIATDGAVRIPSSLNSIKRLTPQDAQRTRSLSLRNMRINGESMDMNKINLRVKLGAIELWDLEGDLHNFHVHGCSFQILSLNDQPPTPSDSGWKDTVTVNQKARIIMQFNHPADENFPFMHHCHMLEHEDMGMMGQFTVTA